MSRAYFYYTEGDRYALARGWLRDWLKVHGIPAMYSASRKGWWIHRDRFPDVVAQLEHDGYAVLVKHRERGAA